MIPLTAPEAWITIGLQIAVSDFETLAHTQTCEQTVHAMSSHHSRAPRYDGPALLAMFESALRLLEANVPEINRLNVFPVPDGDTGTNMYLTLRDIVSKSGPEATSSVADTSRVMAREALMGGRGNSGVLLSHFFMGMAEALESSNDFGGMELARSLASASVHAYGGIGHPREGTILTVMRESADATQKVPTDDIAPVLQIACDAALDAVGRTPTMLAVLYRAGLVDSGGYGYYVILEGMRRHLMQTGDLDELLVPPQPNTDDGNISAEFLDEIEDEQFGFCTQFMIQGTDLDKDAIMARMLELGQSPVVIGNDELIRVHVHTYNPDEVIAYAEALGSVSNQNIQDMDEQRERYSSDRRAELAGERATAVAVVQGPGLEQIFRDQGIEHMVSGGDTMNPSVADLVRAIEDTPTDSVVFLPNNPNIILAAQQAAGLSSKTVRVVPSRTVVQGISAALEYIPEGRSLDELAGSMEDRLGDVRTGEICLASREADLDGVSVEEDQVIAMLDRELVYAADTVGSALTGLLQKTLDEDPELVTLYWGDLIDEGQAEELAVSAAETFPEIEFEVVHGGQPHYHLFLSIE